MCDNKWSSLFLFQYIYHGCRQGDLLSPYIFILCAKILAHLIRKNDNVKGITVNDKEFLASQYADDTTLILDGSEESLKTCLSILKFYADTSGLHINMEKNRVIWIGSRKGSQEQLCTETKLNWDQNIFTVISIIFSINLQEMIDINYSKAYREIKNILIQWSKRKLTPFGKITIIKSLAMAKMNHYIMSLPNPSYHFLKDLNRLFYNFVWNNKIDRVKRTVAIKPNKQGGLK